MVRLELSGDFFFHPEEGLKRLEAFLLEKMVWKMDDPETAVSDFMNERGYRSVGFGPSDLAYLLRGLKC